MIESAVVLIAVALTAGLLVWPRIRDNRTWRATVTPIASIIGSGFLVLAPILNASFGQWAPLVMAGLCAAAYGFGSAIRFNIRALDSGRPRSRTEHVLDEVASWALALAYIVAVAYYLNLFGAFGVSLFTAGDQTDARILTTAVFLVILVVGWARGFEALEHLEQVSVTIKLAVIGGLAAGLAVFLGEHVATGELILAPAELSGWQALALVFGLIVTVQGFETSRYLGGTYDAPTRIRSMRLAQWLSTAIYVVYIGLIAYVFEPHEAPMNETGVIDMMRLVAPVLPLLLVVAALSAQFSAAIADTGGAGGLFAELSGGRIDARHAYAALVISGIALTWTVHVFEIIAYASRAFAVYYALQSAIAGIAAWRSRRMRYRAVAYGAMTLFGVLVVIFGVPVEH